MKLREGLSPERIAELRESVFDTLEDALATLEELGFPTSEMRIGKMMGLFPGIIWDGGNPQFPVNPVEGGGFVLSKPIKALIGMPGGRQPFSGMAWSPSSPPDPFGKIAFESGARVDTEVVSEADGEVAGVLRNVQGRYWLELSDGRRLRVPRECVRFIRNIEHYEGRWLYATTRMTEHGLEIDELYTYEEFRVRSAGRGPHEVKVTLWKAETASEEGPDSHRATYAAALKEIT